jgi:hypothetical protein
MYVVFRKTIMIEYFLTYNTFENIRSIHLGDFVYDQKWIN